MSEQVVRQPGLIDALMGRWQIPMLAVALLTFGAGLSRLIVGHETPTFEQHIAKLDALTSQNAMTRAHAYVLYLMKDTELPDEQRGELHLRLVGIIHRVEISQRNHSADNRMGIISNFKSAVNLGATPTATDWFALAQAYEWSDRSREAIDAYRRSISEGVARQDRVHRRLVELSETPGQSLKPESLLDLDAILADETASPTNYLWAMERRTRWLLKNDHVDDATALVADARKRLAGTADEPAVAYSEALCLQARGEVEAATTTLLDLRRDWPARDELWGRSGWLLAQLHQQDDRPQSALTLYEDVLSSFVDGPIYEACELGRAECLVALERYDRALDLFGELAADVRANRSRSISREGVFGTIFRVADALQNDGKDALAVRYLELASTLLSSDDEARGKLVGRIAAGYERLAHEPVGEDGGTEAKLIVPYLRRAAELHREASSLFATDPDAAAQALQSAAAAYDAAGILPAVIETLDELVTRFPGNQRRADALLRLARAYQATDRHREAAATFDKLIVEYPRWPESLTALRPLAESLLRLSDEDANRGVVILSSIVDDRGADAMFTPDAVEYRDALFSLAEYLAKAPTPTNPADSLDTQARLAAAIVRIDDAIALYPDHPKLPRLNFLRAEALRRTARMIVDDERSAQSPDAQSEASRRLASALSGYQVVQSLLARRDDADLSALERTYLRASYLYVADCLFDLGRIDDAVEAYREAAWRYENDPIAVSAAMQVAHCFHRLGQPAESRAALGRMRWLVEKIPAESFDRRAGMSPKSYWLALLDRMERTGV